jgi:hypothetical protein
VKFIINSQEKFPVHLYTTFTQGTSIVFIHQNPTNLFLKNVHSKLASKFSTLYHLVWQYLRRKSKIQSSMKKILNYTLHLPCRWIFCVYRRSIGVIFFYNMFIVFYTVKIVYNCVFMTCSTSCLSVILTDQWNLCT